MRIIVFGGPSLPPNPTLPEHSKLLPPARLGDVLAAATLEPRPETIALIDGSFEEGPPVRHKEILYAISKGIAVLGGASMGALRAAELAPFGMTPIGIIANAYIQGRLLGRPFVDDDEVAIAHGPAELGYPLLSEAMVNIRMSLAAAVASQIISASTEETLLELAKKRFFKERSYEVLMRDGERAGLSAAELVRFQSWLEEAAVDQKRADARAVLETAGQMTATQLPAEHPSFQFEATQAWLDLVESASGGTFGLSDVAHEVMLSPERSRIAFREAMYLLLRDREAARRGWVDANEAEIIDRFRPLLSRRLPEALQNIGAWADVTTAVEAKRVIAQTEQALPSLESLGLSEARLVTWHQRIHGQIVPVPVEDWSRELGFPSPDVLVEALTKEFLYRRKKLR